jgi:Cu-Zn family superoxide dismutase
MRHNTIATFPLFVALTTFLALGSCKSDAESDVSEASAIIEGRSGRRASGFASFTEVPGGVLIVVDIQGATPGTHGIHIAQYGDCDAANASSAGPHFDPVDTSHGSPDSSIHHAGDLGNIEIDQKGVGHYERTIRGLTVRPSPYSVVYRALVLNERADDFKTQPAGDSGARIACGVILPRE